MNNLALIAYRQMLFLEVTEAAEYLGGVGPRTWRYYEAGKRPVPQRVIDQMTGLLECRALLLERMTKEADEYRTLGKGRQVVPFYLNFEDFQRETQLDDYLSYRLDQSVKATLLLQDKVVFY
ncbi:DUF1870 family protein [Salmonella enterica]|nr:DUF1870 family protein [Salmonella enterica]EFO7976570.1 DUF1870 family protein [Salmonella enterica]EGC0267529.1 DUF1870 family protein [Salmonella enterica]